MALFQLLVAAAILVPAPPIKPDGWTGQMAMQKRSGITFKYVKPAPNEPQDGSLTMIEYRVLQDKGEVLLLAENGKEVVVSKNDMILQSEAVAYYSELLDKNPNDAMAFAFRGWANKQKKSLDAAIKDYDRAVELAPNQCAWRNNRALIHIEKKDYDKAIEEYDASIRIFPQYGLAYRNRANCWLKKKDYAKAKADLEKAIDLAPDIPYPYMMLARLCATCPDEKFRDGQKALEMVTKAEDRMKTLNGSLLDTLAAVRAEIGEFQQAAKYQEMAFTDPYFAPDKEKADEARKRLQLYRENKPYRDEGP
jgi:tetratricopeptide (TPR) repeat protein